MLKHDAGQVLHSEGRSNVQQIQRAVGSPGELFFNFQKPRLCIGPGRALRTLRYSLPPENPYLLNSPIVSLGLRGECIRRLYG